MKQLTIIFLIVGLLSFFGCNSNKKKTDDSALDKETQDLIDKSFKEFNNRKIYDKLTDEIIDQTSDDNLLQTVFDNIETNFEDGELYSVEKIRKLSDGKQAIFSIWMLQAEVNNGGFNQFYYNSSGQFSEMALTGLKLINAEKFADLLDRANKTYSKIADVLKEKDDGKIESFSESYDNSPLNKLDDEFYELDETERLDSIQIKYIRENKTQFTD